MIFQLPTKTVPETNERVDNGEGCEEEDQTVEDVMEEVPGDQDVESQELDRQTESSQRYLNQNSVFSIRIQYSHHTAPHRLIIKKCVSEDNFHIC